jgi:hypothetical protein
MRMQRAFAANLVCGMPRPGDASNSAGGFSHRGHCERLDDYQYSVGDFAPM